MFRKILIANRGEIAVRVIRACREMGIETVTIYSEADRLALHVRQADEAHCVGPPPSTESYLAMDNIIQVAKKSGAEAIHPGYGFLAENPEFARRIESDGLTFIGPPASAMELMGNKTAARRTMRKAGVPIIPGADRGIEDEEAKRLAREMGYPVLVKAAAGGGGKGMRVVYDQKELSSALRGARSEASSAFGDGTVYLEKYLAEPRHIEFQILADSHGNVIHLGERECSIQRRYQKVIEESPSCVLDDELRREMGEAAVRVATAAGYTNAGTVEFLVDRELNFYFLEMNTRLQVEHPVTELRTGVDLVKQQIRVAAGERLGLSQEDIEWRGAAIECRIYAEDPDNDFFPSTGVIEHLQIPTGPGVRDDGGIYQGYEVTLYYDPLLSKLIVWGGDRREAIARMRRALSEYEIFGIKTTIPFHRRVMDNPRFNRGDISTHFIEEEFEKQTKESPPPKIREVVAIVASLAAHRDRSQLKAIPKTQTSAESRWKTVGRSMGLQAFAGR